ncbi:Conserved hypothetical protein [Salinibacter ruber M8]|uniref:Uncharacterized protein n=1 Tax=Salinibacter ruber (strain M8) TaxID=761659 RepID=D5H4V9_SALRM|nr:Conserved hypothetical protein [Salinibacter ruber M8]
MIYGSGALRGASSPLQAACRSAHPNTAHAPSLRKAPTLSEENMNAPKRR